jgi:uncharacterized protein (DUF1501 family)
MNMLLNRRTLFAAGMGSIALSAYAPQIAWAAPGAGKRFVFIMQRGAADGLSVIAPIGDPDFLRARGDPAQDAFNGAKLDTFFALHPAMGETAKLYAQNQAAFVHAAASGYRERSHFDAQNVMESGAIKPFGRDDGWMNRLLKLLASGQSKAIAVAPSVPLILRGPAPVSSYAKSRMPGAGDDLMQRVAMLYAEDAQLSALWNGALQTDATANMSTGAAELRGGGAIGAMAAGLMKGSGGAHVLMLETNGWDTHSAQQGRLSAQLKQTDALIAGLRDGLGADWSNTLVIMATEFGRTVAFNGTAGTDHGTASAIMLYGGLLQNGGKVISDWPGLGAGKLYQNRDLRPTTRFEDVIVAALSHHYAMEPGKLKRGLFPEFA